MKKQKILVTVSSHNSYNYDGAMQKQSFSVRYTPPESRQYLLCQAGKWRFGSASGEYSTSTHAARHILQLWKRAVKSLFLHRYSWLLLAAIPFLSACAITPISFRRHEIYIFKTDKGPLTVHVAGQTRVNDEMLRCGETDKVYGFYDEEKNEIWTTAYIDTIMHELRHFFEGRFHE